MADRRFRDRWLRAVTLPAVTLLAAATLLPGPLLAGQEPASAEAADAAAPVLGHPHGPLPAATDCGSCHSSAGWSPLRSPLSFDHDRETSFVLLGRHLEASCDACHLDLRFDSPRVALAECGFCHTDVHEGTLSSACGSCHDAQSFRARARPDTHMTGSFPLTGSHTLVTCESCHPPTQEDRFAPLPTECAACHLTDYETAITVDHVEAGFPTECLICHNTVAWFHTVRVPPEIPFPAVDPRDARSGRKP